MESWTEEVAVGTCRLADMGCDLESRRTRSTRRREKSYRVMNCMAMCRMARSRDVKSLTAV